MTLRSIVTSEAASPLVKAAAADLQRLLREITGANFAVETGTGQRGVVLGTAMDFPAIRGPVSFQGGPFGREEYILRSRSDALYLIGATDLAVQDAVGSRAPGSEFEKKESHWLDCGALGLYGESSQTPVQEVSF